jgi:NADH dehydrogenase [ubiquinone] 1 alpha subcomplex assembly factor 7
MSEITPILQQLIHEQGAVSISSFMALCLGHPVHGYYMNQEPFGVLGDFTTAPEISQLFGEMLGVWVMQKAPEQKPFQIVELGPGRGTLMKDVWRSLSSMPSLRDHLEIHLVEFSPRLRAIQQDTLHDIPNVTWHESCDTIPQKHSLIIANEFFDALPIEQAIYHQNNWYQRRITCDENGFSFTRGAALDGIDIPEAQEGSIFEYAPIATQIMDDLCYFLRKNNGAMIAIDYGDDVPLHQRLGETLQALHKHAPCSIFDYIGKADLTSHVSFMNLHHVALEQGCTTSYATQRSFLTDMGIRLRADKLITKATLEQARTLKTGLERLLSPDQMGELFKVLIVQP